MPSPPPRTPIDPPAPGPLPAPRSAYVHVPFCAHRCGYCNFTVVAGRETLEAEFLTAVEREWMALDQSREVDTLYFGGGTPTQLSRPGLERLCELALRWHPLAPGYEWTVEANPDDWDTSLARFLADRGVTRVSLGVQSFLPWKLASLERQHTPAQAAQAVESIHAVGMQAAVDLIFGVSGETLPHWQADLAALTALAPAHASTYGLTYEKGTSFWSRLRRGGLAELSETLQRAMYVEGIERLAEAGLAHYEISNFARPGCQSRHNRTYWEGAGYFAVGPGASRYVDGVRETNHRSTTTYLRRMARGESPVAERECLTSEARARERLILGLRTLAGIDVGRFETETHYHPLALAGPALERFAALGLIVIDPQRIFLTRAGLLISDGLWPELV